MIALVAAAVLTVAPGHATAATAVPTVAVGQGAAAAGFELDGALEPVRQSTVAAQVPGNVLQLLVQAGDRVAAGQVIARIDERDAQAGLARSDAAVAQAEAELRNARVHLERSRELRAQQFVSQAALDVAETQYKAAEAGLRQAQAGRTQAALARGFAAVTAPFAGVVLATHLEAGDLASPGRPIATIYAPGVLRAVVQVPGSRMALARSARRVEVQLPGRAQWTAPSSATALPVADAVSQTVEWRLDLPADAAAGQLPGATVRVRFVADAAAPVGDAEVPTVPAGALLRRGELTAVYVAQGERFVLRAVRTGAAVGDRVQVLAGLKPGERVAADPVRAGLAGATPAP
ncbi:efflux RND transporter periplasmic adaptor subunit [Azohydromonas sp.]|uniref:efflux RND transporter periplasmic adaptor subunit n=1 Tax=Azohydromonas sp. TaxID=1872666 RepID=UPI002B69FECF|nr:efflux RND transporter periplasmic adaptor subunit [Azohydromonas sp.]HMM86608.1 efflux RND transporter periplasmic adaptor subunit [Azohydromonas sp.]